MTRVAGEWLTDPATQSVFAFLQEAGYQAYAVGGCVRNALLDATVADVDFATNARPQTVTALAQKAGLHPVPTGIEHGTVTVVSGGVGHEVTTYRKDIETDGRRAIIAFADHLEEDAHRRDFTINALYADQDGTVTDPLGGLADIITRRVRFIDDAGDRIREDYLRILRFFRFHAWFGDPDAGIDPEALAACAELAEGLESLSKERIGAEMHKLLSAPDPAPSLATMDRAGILARILPGANSAALTVLVHLEGEAGLPASWIRRLASLGGANHKELLRLSKSDSRRLTLYLEQVGKTQSVAELAYRHDAATGIDVALLRAAMIGGPLPADLINQATISAGAKFPVRASDIDSSLKGLKLGARLKQLEADWIASGFRLSKDELLG